MTQMTPSQVRTRGRIETLIRMAAPVLDLLLAAGERVSRLVEPEDHEYYPPRPRGGHQASPGDGLPGE